MGSVTARGHPAEGRSEQTPAAGKGRALRHLGEQREQHLLRPGRRGLEGVRSSEGSTWLERETRGRARDGLTWGREGPFRRASPGPQEDTAFPQRSQELWMVLDRSGKGRGSGCPEAAAGLPVGSDCRGGGQPGCWGSDDEDDLRWLQALSPLGPSPSLPHSLLALSLSPPLHSPPGPSGSL